MTCDQVVWRLYGISTAGLNTSPIQCWQSEDRYMVGRENVLETTQQSFLPTWKVIFVVILFFPHKKSKRSFLWLHQESQSNRWRWLDIKEIFALKIIFRRSILNYPDPLPNQITSNVFNHHYHLWYTMLQSGNVTNPWIIWLRFVLRFVCAGGRSTRLASSVDTVEPLPPLPHSLTVTSPVLTHDLFYVRFHIWPLPVAPPSTLSISKCIQSKVVEPENIKSQTMSGRVNFLFDWWNVENIYFEG